MLQCSVQENIVAHFSVYIRFLIQLCIALNLLFSFISLELNQTFVFHGENELCYRLYILIISDIKNATSSSNQRFFNANGDAAQRFGNFKVFQVQGGSYINVSTLYSFVVEL